MDEENQLQAFLDISPCIVMIVDADFHVVSLNKFGRDFLGYDVKDPEIRGLKALFPTDAWAEIEGLLGRLMTGDSERPVKFQTAVRLKSDEIRTIAWHATIFDRKGAGTFILCVGNDITEQCRIEEDLRDSEELYRSIFNSNADAFLIFDTQGNIVDANEKACEVYGYGYDELLKLSGKNIVHPDYRHLFIEFKNTRPGNWFKTESVDVRKNGDFFPIEIHGTSFYHRGEQRLFAIVRDITQRSLTARALKESEEKYRQLVELSPDGISVTVDDKIVFMNSVGLKMVGARDIAEITGKSFFELLAPEFHETVRKRIVEIIKGKELPFIEQKWVRLDGSVVEVEAKGALIQYERRPALQIVFRDITERKHAQRELAEVNLFKERILETSPVGIFAYDSAGQCTSTNETGARLIGTTPAEARKLNFRKIKSWQESGLLDDAEKVLATGTPARALRHMTTTFGKEVWLDCFLARFFAGGEPHLLIEFADISDIKRAEQDLKAKDAEIRQAYVDVLSAVTGGRLVLMTNEELLSSLGNPISDDFLLSSYEDLSPGRKVMTKAVEASFPNLPEVQDLVLAANEAMTNAVKHGGEGRFRLFGAAGSLQIKIEDIGPGIDFSILPKATLLSGFSTKQTLGVGFTIMLEMSDRVLLATQPGKTTVVLEKEV